MMAGSLAHILNDDGTFRGLDLIDSEGDKWSALAECHQIIAELLETIVKNANAGGHSRGAPMGVDWTNKQAVLRLICVRLGFPVPTVEDAHMVNFATDQVVVPVIQPDLHGSESVYQPPETTVRGDRDCLIWSEEHKAWWRPHSRGYTDEIKKAGRYGRQQADNIVANANFGGAFNEIVVEIPEGL